MIPATHLWDLEGRFTRAQELRPVARGKVVGGSGAVNGQVFLRGLPEDFDAWRRAGNPGWDFASLLPVFRAIEADLDFDDHWHGRDGPTPVRRYARARWLPAQAAFHEAARGLGFRECADANGPDPAGIAPIPFNNVGGLRLSTAVTYLAAARERPNLEIRALTHARRLLLRGRRATALEVAGPGRDDVVAADRYVLCAGAFGTPHLLLLSGVGPAAELRRAGVAPFLDVPAVGRHLFDHQVVDLWWPMAPGSPEPAPRAPLLQAVLTYTAAGSGLRSDMKVTVRNRLMGRDTGATRGPVLAIVPGVYHPASRGAVTLRSPDPSVPPAIEFRFLAEEADRRRLRDGVRLAEELARQPPLAGLLARRGRPAAGDAALERWMLATVRSSQHPAGTCRMGPASDPDAVVDPAGAVRGLDNVSVADASVFPSPVRAHTNATTMVVAERISAALSRSRAG